MKARAACGGRWGCGVLRIVGFRDAKRSPFYALRPMRVARASKTPNLQINVQGSYDFNPNCLTLNWNPPN